MTFAVDWALNNNYPSIYLVHLKLVESRNWRKRPWKQKAHSANSVALRSAKALDNSDSYQQKQQTELGHAIFIIDSSWCKLKIDQLASLSHYLSSKTMRLEYHQHPCFNLVVVECSHFCLTVGSKFQLSVVSYAQNLVVGRSPVAT